ncbi:hypothetical protein Tco_0542557 [Tanacetum coccineum]
MANMEKKSSMETFAPNDKADYYSGITSLYIITLIVNRKNAYELKEKLLDDLHNNAFSGTNGKDVVEHVDYFLKIVDPINLPNVSHDKLRVGVFPISLAGSIDEIEVYDNESSDLEDYLNDKEEETTKNFKIETDVFYYETPLYVAFNEFNYLLKVDPDLLTKDIMGLKPMKTIKTIRSTNGTRMYHGWKSHEITYPDHDEIEYENETHDERHKLCETNELPICNMRRFKMMKYSFGQDEEYVAVKEDEYNDLARTSEDAS